MWVVAMLVVGGVYWYSTRNLKNGPVPAEQSANDDSVPTMALGSSMLPLIGTWLDGKAPELKNKVVVLDFWGTFCMPCIQSIPANTKLVENYGPKGLVFIGVSREPKVRIEEFKNARAIRYPLFASNDAAFEKHGIQAIPATLLFDKHGKLVWKGNQFEGPDGSMLESFAKALKTALAEPDEAGGLRLGE